MGIRRMVKMQEPVIWATWQRRATEFAVPELLTILMVLPWYALTACMPDGADTIVH